MFVGNAYLRQEHMKGATLWYALALLSNITLGWKSLQGANTQASYDKS